MSRKGKRKKDPRVTLQHTKLKTSGILFVMFLIVNSAYMLIYQSVFGIEPTFKNLLVPEPMLLLLFASFIMCLIVSVGRNSNYDKPIQELGQAAKRIAEGDFSIRVSRKKRKNGEKDYLDVLYEDFNTMAEELSTIETLKSDFVANVSHEIKTPLAILQSYAAALQNETLDPEKRKEYSRTIVTASQRLGTLVTNILKLSKLENQEIGPKGEAFDLGEQLRRCVLSFEDLWEKKGLRVEVEIADGLTVRFDESMVEIIWNNLLSNAMKFTEPGGTVRVTLKGGGGVAEAVVSDTGCGMDQLTEKHIFEQFYQGDTSHAQEGNGLGLALVGKVLELLGGGISVDSRMGEGAAFRVWLPLADTE